MDKDINKLLFRMIKYDLVIGMFICLAIGFSYSFIYTKVYFSGICVALMNFVFSGYITSKFLNNAIMHLLLSILRITLILITLIPFIKSNVYMIYYMMGFVSHYIILVIFGVKNRKGSV